MHPRTTPVAAWAAALAGFVILSALASFNDTFPGDVWLAQHLQEIDLAPFTEALDYTEDVADLPWLVLVWLGTAVFVLRAIGWQQAIILVSGLSGRLLNSGLKELIGRPRPSLSLVEAENQPGSLSFPSGHAESAVLLWGMLFYFATVHLGDARMRLPAQALCLWFIVATGVERVYAGDHWPSDVLGGFYIGVLLLACLIAAERLVRPGRQ